MLLSFFAGLALSQATAPIAPIAPDFDQVDHHRQLDAWLTADAYRAIAKVVLEPKSEIEARASLNWLGAAFKRGESPFIAWAYAKLLVGMANGVPDETALQMKGSALAAMLYASSAAQVESLQCADATARTDRTEQFVSQMRTSGLLDIDEGQRRLAALIALGVERRTWDRRKLSNDAKFLCANGMAAISAGIAAGNVTEESGEGQIGRKIEVNPPGDFVYERRENADWWPEAEELRQDQSAVLAALAGIDRMPTREEVEALMAAQ